MKPKTSENMEVLYASIRSWCTEEEEVIPLPYWKGVDEYRDPIEPNSLSTNFTAVFTEVKILLNSCVEQTVTLNDFTQEKNKVLGDESNKNTKFHRMERSMEEAVSTFMSVVEAEELNDRPQKKYP